MYPSDIVEEERIHLAPFVGPCKIGRSRKHNIRDINDTPRSRATRYLSKKF
ncbi:hypothetical protein [Rickettsia endosymbiont of Nabis limbatus]|uniref:hypothetical protein n=1 Tax=Rickettsia endosymbiont of Nabis limbatus TaxID=3066268 RepID=UPI003AF33A8E